MRAGNIQRRIRRLRGGNGRLAGGKTSTTVALLAGELTGLPHLRQKSALSGKVAPHLLHPNRTLVEGGVVLFVDILKRLSALRKSANHQGGNACRY
jgi:hypothetical protein